jgi:hypothetical protein
MGSGKSSSFQINDLCITGAFLIAAKPQGTGPFWQSRTWRQLSGPQPVYNNSFFVIIRFNCKYERKKIY